jgi:hypothetical protein
MGGPESKLWHEIKKANDRQREGDRLLLRRLDGSRVKGWPDVNYLKPEQALSYEGAPRAGWIELKVVKSLISNAKMPEHYTAEQALFLETWGRAGGLAWLLIADSSSWMLIDRGFIDARKEALWEIAERHVIRGVRPDFTNLLEYL